MISLLAFGVVAGQQSSIPRNSPELLDWLKANGYEFTATDSTKHNGFLEHDGGRIGANLIPPPLQGAYEAGTVAGLRFQVEVSFPREVPLDLPVFSPYSDSPAGPEPYFTSHLGRTVTIQAAIDFNEAFSPKGLRNELDQFWKISAKFVADHGGKLMPAAPKDWSKEKFSDRLVLKRADPVSVERLTASWGWTYRGGWGHSGNGYAYPIHVSQTNLFVHWPGNDERFDSAIYLSPFGDRDRMDRIDFSKGIRVKDLRSQIEKIVAKVEKKP